MADFEADFSSALARARKAHDAMSASLQHELAQATARAEQLHEALRAEQSARALLERQCAQLSARLSKLSSFRQAIMVRRHERASPHGR
jgi:septal ring factor EnvC (AmiA/AmiB activator)